MNFRLSSLARVTNGGVLIITLVALSDEETAELEAIS
jgi:hypothetical protein